MSGREFLMICRVHPCIAFPEALMAPCSPVQKICVSVNSTGCTTTVLSRRKMGSVWQRCQCSSVFQPKNKMEYTLWRYWLKLLRVNICMKSGTGRSWKPTQQGRSHHSNSRIQSHIIFRICFLGDVKDWFIYTTCVTSTLVFFIFFKDFLSNQGWLEDWNLCK